MTLLTDKKKPIFLISLVTKIHSDSSKLRWEIQYFSSKLRHYRNLKNRKKSWNPSLWKGMVVLSRRYLHPYFSNDQSSEKLSQPMDPLWTLWPKVSKGGPFVATIFQLISHYSNMNQDIFLKFSAFVHHMSPLN